MEREEVVKVLWVSRHRPLLAQLRELRRIFKNVELIVYEGTVPSAEHVISEAKRHNAKVIVPVLPLSIIARLVELAKKEDIIVLFARMEAIATTKSIDEAEKIVKEAEDKRNMTTYSDGTIRVFEFKQFEKILRVELVTEHL
jgi:hypothetical protein